MSFLSTKRLLKDLPFLQSANVLVKCYGTYRIHSLPTLYDNNLSSSSSNGVNDLDKKEKEIVDEIWDNPKWFEDATFSEPKWMLAPSHITIFFDKPVDNDELVDVAKAIQRTLRDNYKKTTQEMGWKELTDLF